MLHLQSFHPRPFALPGYKIILVAASILLVLISLGGKPAPGAKKVNRPQIVSTYRMLDVNQISCIINSDGTFADSRKTGAAGLEWPKGTGKTAVYTAGLWLTGIHHSSGAIRTALMYYESDYQPGPLLETFNTTTNDGSPAVSRAADPRYRPYKVQRTLPLGDPATQTDSWLQWPGDLGAPYLDVNANGKWDSGIDEPKFFGDEQIWCVINDADTALHGALGYTFPLGVEVRCLYYAFDARGPIGNTAFLRWEIINKSDADYDSMYATLWSDVDLGDGNDDLPGCDTTQSLSYMYNADNNDGTPGFGYGTNPPADGFMMLAAPGIPGTASDSAYWGDSWVRGVRSLPMTAATAPSKHWSPILEPFGPGTDWMTRNIQQGKVDSGYFLVSPTTGQPMVKWLTGDPVAGAGDLPANFPLGVYIAGDNRFQSSSGPFALARGDTQHLVEAFVISQGTDNLNSVTLLKHDAREINKAFFEGLPIASIAPLPGFVPLDSQLTLTGYARATRGAISATRWSLMARPAGSLSTIQDSLSPTATIIPDAAGTYAVRFVDELPSGLRDTAVTSFQAIPNRPPVVAFSVPGQIVLGDTIHIDGSAIQDPGGDPLSIQWNVDGGAFTPYASLSFADTSMGRLEIISPNQALFIPYRSATFAVSARVSDAYYSKTLTKDVVVNPITTPNLQVHARYETSGIPSSDVYGFGPIREFGGTPWYLRDGSLFTPNFAANANPAQAFVVRTGNYWVEGGRVFVMQTGGVDLLTTDRSHTILNASSIAEGLTNATCDLYYRSPYVFFSEVSNGVVAYDVTNPSASLKVSEYTDHRQWGSFVVEGNLMYGVPNGNVIYGSRLQILDITDPGGAGIVPTAWTTIGNGYFLIKKSGNRVFLVKADTISVYDVSDTSYIFHVVDIPVPLTVLPKNQFYDICPYGSYLLAGTHEGCYVYDLTSIATPSIYAKYITGFPTVSTFLNARRLMCALWDSQSLMEGPVSGRQEGFLEFETPIVSVPSTAARVPGEYALDQNYPNPFNPSTTIRYGLPQRAHVTLEIFTVLGQLVRRLVDQDQEAGYHEVSFQASSFASGVYFYRIQAANFVQAKKLVLLR